MKIAQVSSLMEAVPPKLYGGTERIVAYLTDELVAMGHDVTLFASGDSVTTAKLEAACPQALRLDSSAGDYLAPHILMLEMLARRASEFDVVHLHIDYLSYPVVSRADVPNLDRRAAAAYAHVISGAAEQAARWWREHTDVDVDDMVGWLMDSLWSGLREIAERHG